MDAILANRHSDVNFLTIHGRSRYPGLDIWTRNFKTGHWQKIGVEIPPGCSFIVQAGKQLEHITGGLIKAGPHDVVVKDRTLKSVIGDSDANILCAHLAFFTSLLNDGSHQPFSGTCHLITIWLLSPR